MPEIKKAGLGTALGIGALLGAGYLGHRALKKRRSRADDLSMPLRDIDSSMIRQVGYNPERRSMVVRFNTGRRYAYKEVPIKEYKALIGAESAGKHFNKKVKDMYSHTKIAQSKKDRVKKVLADYDRRHRSKSFREDMTRALEGRGGHASPEEIERAKAKLDSYLPKMASTDTRGKVRKMLDAKSRHQTSLAAVLKDLRQLDTPDKWNAVTMGGDPSDQDNLTAHHSGSK